MKADSFLPGMKFVESLQSLNGRGVAVFQKGKQIGETVPGKKIEKACKLGCFRV